MSKSVRTLLVGDVHGCLDELLRLLKVAGYARGDRLILVGDLVAKGPDSEGVVAAAREQPALMVRGNHDEAVLRVLRRDRRGIEPQRPPKREHERVAPRLSDDDFAYLEAAPTYLDLAELNTWVVHAGVVPGKDLASQRTEDLLVMRTLRPDGTASSRLDEGEPWAKAWHGPAHVVFGHDAISGLQRHPFASGLDTGCVYGGRLTALSLPEGRLFSVPAKRAYRELEE